MIARPAGLHRRPRPPRRLRVPAAAAALLLGIALVPSTVGQAGAAVGVPTTYAGPTYDSTVKRPSENKPQSKLWYTAGAWWGLLVSRADNRVHIWELLSDKTWRDTGVQVDDRLNASGDAHWDEAEQKLTVASRTKDTPLKVNRFTLTGSRTWVRDAGFPVTVSTGGGSESAAIDRDTTGAYWVTYTRGSRVWVARSDATGRNWTAGYQPQVSDTVIASDDISSVIAFKGRIGVVWSDQQSGKFRMALHTDGTPDNQWVLEDAMADSMTGPNWADDHINLKTVLEDDKGRIYAAVKTSLDAAGPSAPLVGVLIRTPRPDGTGQWDFVVAGTVADDHTRPIIQIDKINKELYFFATAPVSGGDIYYKKTSLADPSFGPGRGQKFMDATPYLNNATGSKQPVTAESGMLILAVAEGKKQYYHGFMELAGGTQPPPPSDTTPPSTPTGLTATATAGQVSLSWDASDDPSGIKNYDVFRDGSLLTTVTTTSNTDTAVTPGQTYSYTVRARDNANNVSEFSSPPATATVPSEPPPPTGGGVAFRAAATAANNAESTVRVPLPAHQPGDVLLASIDWRGQSAVTPPAGWTQVRLDSVGTAMRKATYWRVATAAEPASYTWTFGAQPAAVGSISAYSGVDPAAPVEAAGGQTSDKSTSITAPSVLASAGSQLVALFGVARGAAIAPPAGLTERSEVRSPATVTYPIAAETADRAAGSDGATGSLVAQSTVSGPNIGHTIALRRSP